MDRFRKLLSDAWTWFVDMVCMFGGVICLGAIVVGEKLASALKPFRRVIAATIIFALLCAIGVFMNGDAVYQGQGVIMGGSRLVLLMLWALFSGAMLDVANGVKFSEDRDLIKDGNVAVAISRSVGYAALVIAGAVLIAQI